ncbi:HAD family hydrolase [Candidatus Woesearchaeota archaeon]|nr:HAD family hydrolase [Candidatus Woesearchaeota archaeon]
MLTKIPKDKQLIIFDFYETIIHSAYYNNNFLRAGIRDLVNELKDESKSLVISSDADISEIIRDFGYAAKLDFLDNFRKIYGRETIRVDNVGEESKIYKDLGSICNEQDIPISKAIFIGDNHQGVDEYSASRFGMDYIIVPTENKDFSFVSLFS